MSSVFYSPIENRLYLEALNPMPWLGDQLFLLYRDDMGILMPRNKVLWHLEYIGEL